MSAYVFTDVRTALEVWGVSAYSGRTNADGRPQMNSRYEACVMGVWVNRQAWVSVCAGSN